VHPGILFPFDEAGRNEMPHGDTGMLPHGEEGSLSGGSCLSESADSFVLWQDPIGFACEKVRDLCITTLTVSVVQFFLICLQFSNAARSHATFPSAPVTQEPTAANHYLALSCK
jgi:hypothetical protein